MSGFSDIIGHNEIKSLCLGALASGRISHAYLFNGPSGVGKNTTAGVFAKSLLCFEPGKNGACGVCRSCRQYESGNHPNFHSLLPDGASIKIFQIRQLQEKVSLRPFQGTRQVFVIHHAHSMTKEAANSFLKVLEEPPAGVVFILLSDNPQSMPTTVLSRCQQVNFKPLSNQEIIQGLKRMRGLRDEESRLPAALAGGSLGQALELLGNNTERNELLSLVEKLDKAGAADICFLAGELAGKEVDLQRLMDMLVYWYRDILMCKEGLHDLIVNSDYSVTINSKARDLTVRKIINNIKTVEKTKTKLTFHANARLSLEALFFSLAGIGDK